MVKTLLTIIGKLIEKILLLEFAKKISYGSFVVTVSHLVELKLGDLVYASKVWKATRPGRGYDATRFYGFLVN